MLFCSAVKRTTGTDWEFRLFWGGGVWGELGAGNEVIQRDVEDFGHRDQGIQAGGAAGLLVHAQGAWANGKFLSQLLLAHAHHVAQLCNSVC